ncbi:MAG: hypothetical protein HDR55_03405 [Treponema sp.]|nr:hypothetical protein [Treponema sp.]
MFEAGMSVLALVVIAAVVLIALLPLFFLIDMYRFVKKIANSSIQQEEHLRKLVVIAKKYYQRDFAESEKKDADDNPTPENQ